MKGRGLIVMKIGEKNVPAWKKQHLIKMHKSPDKFEKNSCLARVKEIKFKELKIKLQVKYFILLI